MASKGKDKVNLSSGYELPKQTNYEVMEARLTALEKKVEDLEAVVSALCFEPEDKQPSPKNQTPKEGTSNYNPQPMLKLEDLHHHSSPSYSPESDASYGGCF